MRHGDDHHHGLAGDLKTMAKLAGRRRILGFFAGATLLSVLGCEGEADGTGGEGGSGAGGSTSSGTSNGECSGIPEETAGPYPGDGTNGANALVLDGIVRSDIRSSIGGLSGTAEGIPLTVTLTVVDDGDGCASLAGYAVYLWHCDRDGNYSMYTVTDQNYLRGVQETDEEGKVTFTTIFPACYAGRMPHIHFEVYESLEAATSGHNAIATSQLALPTEVCGEVYETDGYAQSVQNLGQISFASDNVFSDGVDLQLAEVTGAVEDGYVATLTVAV
ncbi:intradiol ring-cleavage dioxygenase [Chondromyces apiculatus]|nr:intradiol ring-cleavage dioxygenase [Chondromyces apiculatus]